MHLSVIVRCEDASILREPHFGASRCPFNHHHFPVVHAGEKQQRIRCQRYGPQGLQCGFKARALFEHLPQREHDRRCHLKRVIAYDRVEGDRKTAGRYARKRAYETGPADRSKFTFQRSDEFGLGRVLTKRIVFAPLVEVSCAERTSGCINCKCGAANQYGLGAS